jgi:hypothetical protein
VRHEREGNTYNSSFRKPERKRPCGKPGRRYEDDIVARMRGDYYKTGFGLTTGFIRSHTVTHNYSVYALQLTTVHYHTCRVFTPYLHSLPVFQSRRIRSPATLQLFSEECCSARILTRIS